MLHWFGANVSRCCPCQNAFCHAQTRRDALWALVSAACLQAVEQEVKTAAQKRNAADKEQEASEESDQSLSDGTLQPVFNRSMLP